MAHTNTQRAEVTLRVQSGGLYTYHCALTEHELCRVLLAVTHLQYGCLSHRYERHSCPYSHPEGVWESGGTAPHILNLS
jgi:hypothetical protein